MIFMCFGVFIPFAYFTVFFLLPGKSLPSHREQSWMMPILIIVYKDMIPLLDRVRVKVGHSGRQSIRSLSGIPMEIRWEILGRVFPLLGSHSREYIVHCVL
jgi:hypothetical protein